MLNWISLNKIKTPAYVEIYEKFLKLRISYVKLDHT